MAIKYLVGLDVDGNIDLNSNQIKEVRIDNLAADPTGSAGRIYYNTSSTKLRYYNGTAWNDLSSATDTNTTYDLSGVGSTNGTAGVRLAGSDGTNDDVIITGAGTVGVTRSGNTLTVTGTDSAAGTVTNVLGGTGVTVTGTSTVTPTVNITYSGVANAILEATTQAITDKDFLWFSADADSVIYKQQLSAFPGFGKDGTVTSVGSGAGLTGGAITASGSLEVDYAGADNIILAAADGVTTPITVASTDKIIVSDATDSNVKFVNISQITAAIGGGTVTSIDVSGGTTGLTTSGGAVTTSGTITLAGTLAAGNGGTGQSVYTVGDILYASSTTALTKLGIGSTGQVLKVASGIPSWATDANAGGTVTSIGITETGSALTITNTPITTSGDINIAGAGNNTQVILGDLTLGSYTQGTVTSVATGAGLKGGTITATGTVEVDYGTSGLIQDAPLMGQVPKADDLILIQDAASGTGVTVKQPLGKVSLSVFDAPSADLSFGNFKLTSLANGTASKDGVNLGQVQALVAGVGVFQGGYDASANSPAIAGASNIALTTGDFFVVTKDGTIAFNGSTVDVEVGDTIYANQAIGASSNPPASDYAIVIQDQNIAGVGATDGATEKGVAGFSSATFAGTATGFITVKAGGISDAQLASTFNKIIGTDTDINTSGVDVMDQINVTDGVITSMSKRTLPNAATGSVGVTEIATQAEVDAGTDTFRYVTPATLASAQSKQSYTGLWPSANASSWKVLNSDHSLGNGPFIIQTYTSSGDQIFMDVNMNITNGDITFTAAKTVTANSVRVVMQVID